MRLIDADALFDEFENSTDWYENHDRDFVAEEILMNAPTVDAVPVVHGRWENRINEYFRTCSNCEISMGMMDGESLERFCYCPFCGAKMNGKDGDGE